MSAPRNGADVEAINDRLAREHPIDDYYARSFLPIRVIEQRRLALIKRMVGDASDLDLAEVGSGGGHVLRMFPRARITAIDVSEVFLETAKKNLAGYDARFVKGEVDKLDLPSGSFDRIICTEVLEHTVDPDAILATLARMLRPTGVSVITVPNDPLILRIKDIMRNTPVGYVLRDKLNWGGDVYHIHRWTPDEFERLLAKHFRVEERASAPVDQVPIRVCFRCTPKRK